MRKIVIYGLNIIVGNDTIQIENYNDVELPITMYEILEELDKQINRTFPIIETPLDYISIDAIVDEWIARSNLNRLGYKKDTTVFTVEHQPWYKRLVFWFLSRVTL